MQTTLNASRDGLYFATGAEHHYLGMKVRVTFPYASNDLCNMELLGEVVRIERLPDGRRGIAVRMDVALNRVGFCVSFRPGTSGSRCDAATRNSLPGRVFDFKRKA